MSLFGANTPIEAGLQLLLSPGASNIVLRTACCSVGIALPVYSTFKAIERDDPDEKHRCLLYWAAYGSFSIAEIWADKILYWAPFYYHFKFAFLVWLQLPLADGSRQVYMNYLRPFFLRHQARIDSIVGTFYREAILQQMRSDAPLLALENGALPTQNPSTAAEDARLASLISLDGILKQVKVKCIP